MRRAPLGLILLAALVQVAAGCAPTMSYVDTGVLGPRPEAISPRRVRLLYAGSPLPPFVELGYIEANQTVSAHPADPHGFLEGLVEVAAAHGCNAIVLHDGCIRSQWSQRHGRYDFSRLAATCVHIDDPITEPQPALSLQTDPPAPM